MDIEATFPERFWINLARRADRRGEMEWMLERTGLTAERFPAVDARFVRRMALESDRGEAGTRPETMNNIHLVCAEWAGGEGKAVDSGPLVRGYSSAGRYALALTQRLAVRQARQRGADAVLIMEDDVILHPNLRALLEAMVLPEDWGLLYLGCAHLRDPEPAAPGLVRVRAALDLHAFAVRAPYYERVIRALNAHGKAAPDHPRASDCYLAALHDEIPTYACFPNVAWQAETDSDLMGKKYSLYRKSGTQKQRAEIVDRTYERMFGGGRKLRGTGTSKIGLMFLTRGDVHHPAIWREFVAEVPDRVRVFSHPKQPQAPSGGFLEGTEIVERHATEWGSITLVQAALSLLRAALEDETLTHFMLLSESCVPVVPLPEILRQLDWNPKPRFKCRRLGEASGLQKSRATHLPQVHQDCWRFQSQWWLLDRVAAKWAARADYTDVFAKMPIPDEAYFSTVLCLLGYPVDDRVTPVAPTWTHWEPARGRPTEFATMPLERLEEILESGAWFARKFPAVADIGRFGLHRSVAANSTANVTPFSIAAAK